MEPTLTHNGNKRVVVKWDFIKIAEPTGLDPATDEKARNTILKALEDGFEPFAVVPTMVRKNNFSPEAITSATVYFKRPSFVEEAIDESDRVVRP